MTNQPEKKLPQILVAEDDPSILRFVKTILEKEGYVAITARDGAEAYKILASREPFVLALLDVIMPRIQGPDLVKHMKSDRRLMSIPVIMMTAEQSPLLLPESFRSGAVAFLPKPFTAAQLMGLVRLFSKKDSQ
jgi:CheY-like chemotaxis protein